MPAIVLLVVVVGALTLWAIRRVVRPLRASAQTLRLTEVQLQERVKDLEAQGSQAQAILESMVEGVLALDRESRVLWLNPSAQRLFGWTSPQAEGRRLLELFRHPELEALAREVVEQHRPAVREIRTFGPTEQMIRFQATPCEGNERGAAMVLVAQDVTEMRRLEHLRREFVANVSHELKTPLTSIKGLVETLLNGALEDPANNRRFVALIDEDATRLSRLIDDLLQLSEIESKAVPLKLEAVDVAAMVQSLQPLFRQRMQERQLTLEIAIPPHTSKVRADVERLRQVFVNLLDNSVKFSKSSGRITVSAKPHDSMLEISVSDTGVGIPEQDLPRIFERFYRVDKARSRELGGTGLGLSIIKHIVEAHGGAVTVVSRLNQGSTFTLTLPAA